MKKLSKSSAVGNSNIGSLKSFSAGARDAANSILHPTPAAQPLPESAGGENPAPVLQQITTSESVLGPSTTLDSLALPPATLQPSDKTSINSSKKSYGALQEPSKVPTVGEDWKARNGQEIDDHSPLLEAIPTSPYRNQILLPQQQRASSIASLGTSLRNNLTIKSLVNRMSPGGPPKKPPGRNLSEVALNTLISAEEMDFISWLDSQYAKIETFYKEKENDAIERYLLLQDQLFNLREQKIAAKVAKAQDKPVIHIPRNETATRIKKKIAHKMDLPSLPATVHDAIFNHSHESHAAGGGVSRDYVKRVEDDRISYPVARRQLKVALGEYYRSLELLKSYRLLNQTAFRKIIKKFDKVTGRHMQAVYMEKINSGYFCQSDVVDDLLRKTEDMYAMYFENGNHKHAVEKLRAKSVPEEHYMAMFITGLSYGLSIPLLIQGTVKGIERLNDGDPDALFLFQIWGGFFLVILMLALFQVNCLIWRHYKINYPFIFEFDPLAHLDAREMAAIPSVLMFCLTLLGWLCFMDFWPHYLKAIYYPPIFLGTAVFVFLLPMPVIQPLARKWLAVASWRVFFSGLYPVEFRDFFLGDIFCSLTYSISNASFFFCLYATYWSGLLPGDTHGSSCGSSRSRVLGFLNALPGIWRFLQCIRRYLDSGDWFPHLANMGKYGTTILYYVFLSAYRIDRGSNAFRSLFIMFASVNTLYSAFWDLFMDWSLMQSSENFLLRNELGFKSKWPYYCAMVIDPILRCNWIFYAIYANQVQQSAKVSFFVAFSEVIRRFIWVFFRVENEHCTNVVRFRASRDVTLPYTVVVRSKNDSTSANSVPEEGELRVEDEESRVPSSGPSIATPATGTGEQVLPEETESPGMPPVQRQSTLTALSSIATPVLRALSFAIRNAHSRDFQRRKEPAPSDGNAIDSDDDDDDDDDDYDSNSSDGYSRRHGEHGTVLRRRDTRSSDASYVAPSTVKWRDQYL